MTVFVYIRIYNRKDFVSPHLIINNDVNNHLFFDDHLFQGFLFIIRHISPILILQLFLDII
jgi:hypothetical protein